MIKPTSATKVIFKKTIALFVVLSFAFSNVAFADIPKDGSTVDIQKPKEIVTDPEKIVIPRDYGLIKSKYTGKDKRLVIHIQDAHCNYEAQTNITKILDALIKNDGLSLVSVEGADGFIDTSWFKAFPDADIRKEVADYFMKKGEITGPEFLSITTDLPIRLFGAETRAYYIENLNAFTSSYPLKEDTERYFNQIRAVLNKLKNTIYSEELKDFDSKSQDYESKKLSFTDYVKYLETLSQRYKVNVRSYDNLFKLISVLVYEKKINFNVVDKERAALIDAVTKKLTKDQLTDLVNKSLEFKVGKIASAEYYDYLRKLATKYGISLIEDYPNLFNYIIYNSVYSRIENESLFNDIKKFEEALKDKMFSNDDQRTLDKLSRHINTLIGLTNIKLLNGDFDYYKTHKEEFSHEVFAGFIDKMAARFGFAYEVDAPSQAVMESMPKLEDFYAIAIKRDKALVDNTLRAMKKEGMQIAVLVTGGFHSEGITKLLEKEGVSYLVVCPNITKDVETPYIKILTNQRTPLEDILSDTAAVADVKSTADGMLAPYLITAARINGIGGLIEERSTTDLRQWAEMSIQLWLSATHADAGEKHLPFTPEIACALFNMAVDIEVNEFTKKNKKNKKAQDELRIFKFNASMVKRMSAPIIEKLLKDKPVGAIDMSGIAPTAQDHGLIRTSTQVGGNRIKDSGLENGLNGAIARLIQRDGFLAHVVSKNNKIVEGDIEIPLMESGPASKISLLKEELDKLGLNYVVIKGLKKELAKTPGLERMAEDFGSHYGLTRKASYKDEDDFNYLLLLKNGVDIIMQDALHEKAHIDNPDLSEDEIEAIAPSVAIREAMLDRLNKKIEILNYEACDRRTTNQRKFELSEIINKLGEKATQWTKARNHALEIADQKEAHNGANITGKGMNNKNVKKITISEEELAIERVFGTNGMRGGDITIDTQRRSAAATAEILKAQWQKANPGKELPWLMVGFDPRPQGINGFDLNEMGESKAVAEVLAAYGFKIIFVPKAVAAPFMISITGKGVHPRNIYASIMRTASHNEVVDPMSETVRLVSGTKLFIDNAPAPDSVTGLISERMNDKESAKTVLALDFDKAVTAGKIVVVKDGDENDPDTIEFRRLSETFDLAGIGKSFRERFPDIKIAVNTMNGGMSSFAPRMLKGMGFEEGKNFKMFNTTLMNDPSMKDKMTGWIEYTDPITGKPKKVRFAPDPTRKWMRGKDYTDYVASDPAHIIALLIDGDADRLVTELEKEIIPNDIGMLAAYYLAKYKGQKGRIVRTVPTTGGLDALSKALGLGKVQVTPVGSKWFAGPNKYYDGTLNDILVAIEESGHIGFIKENKSANKRELFFDHSIGLSALMLEMMAETGKTWQELSDEMWAFIKEKTGQERIAAVRYGISKEDDAKKYYDLVARLGNPKEGAFRKDFGAKFEQELAASGFPWKVEDFDITDAGGAQFQFVGGRKLFPRKSGTDGSVRLYVEVLETERDKAPGLVNIMRKVMDFFVSQKPAAETSAAKIISKKLHTPLAASDPKSAKKFLKGGYNQNGFGVAAGAAIDGSFAIGDDGNQGYYVKGGKEIFLATVLSMKDFFKRRANILGYPIRYVIKPGIGGQHTPFQGIASAFQLIDLESGRIVGEYELGKDYEAAMSEILEATGADWDQIAVIPSSKSGSTDETMMIFSEIFHILLKNIAEKEGFDGKLFADTIFNTLHDVNFKDNKEVASGDLFKGFNLTIALNALHSKGLTNLTYDNVKKIFGAVLGNMFFETTDRPEASRLSAFMRNSGLDKELGENAPGFGAMFDNVGGRWTADLHMMTFLAYHGLDAEVYWNARYKGIKEVREGKHIGYQLGNKILDEEITDIALVVPDELFWFGKAMEQNLNESIWQKGFANLIAIKQSNWFAQKKYYTANPNRLVINISDMDVASDMPENMLNLVNVATPNIAKLDRQPLANALGDLFTTFYGMTHTVGNRLIARALAEKGYKVTDVDINDLNNPATRIFQQNLYVRQPYVELGKGLLEKRLKALQEKGKTAIEEEIRRVLEAAKKGEIESNIKDIKIPGNISNMEELAGVIDQAVKFAEKNNRKFVPFIYLEGGKFQYLREHLIRRGIEWVMQGTGDQHISYQQVLAQPQKYLPFIISFVPERFQPGRPAIGFAKGYLHDISPNVVRDAFAEASYHALIDKRTSEAGETISGAAGIFMRMADTNEGCAILLDAFDKAIIPEDKAEKEIKPDEVSEFSETEKAFSKPAAEIVNKVLPKTNITGEHAEKIKSGIMVESIGLFTTLNAVTITEAPKKIVILGRDTGLDPVSNGAAQAGSAAIERYLGNSLVEVRGKGRTLLEGIQKQITRLKHDGKIEGNDFVVITIAGNETLDKIENSERKDLGKILNIVNNADKYLPVIGLYDLAIRIAYEQNSDDILRCLNRVASNENGQPFTKDDIEALLNSGLIRILPKTAPVNITEAVEAYKAAESVLRAL